MRASLKGAWVCRDALEFHCPFGKFAVYNFDVSSLTDRREDVHRHALYHTEFGADWRYWLDIADGWRISTDVKRAHSDWGAILFR